MTTRDPIDYNLIDAQLIALTKDEPDMLANSANFVALLYNALTDINWVGIYVLRNGELVLGPFQGKPACVHIPVGQGVCGTAAQSMKTLRVDNVNEFAGHIACDIASNSEIVVPLLRDGELLGVLDIDSPSLARFSASDQQGIEKLCRNFEQTIARNADGTPFI